MYMIVIEHPDKPNIGNTVIGNYKTFEEAKFDRSYWITRTENPVHIAQGTHTQYKILG
jgi:hypothetical protein